MLTTGGVTRDFNHGLKEPKKYGPGRNAIEGKKRSRGQADKR